MTVKPTEIPTQKIAGRFRLRMSLSSLLIMQLLIATMLGWMVGCAGGLTALEPGEAAPMLEAEGWIGEPPSTENRVTVVEAFATW